MITLRPITEDNFQEVLNLDLRSENQTFVDSVAYSLAEAWLYYAFTKPFAIYYKEHLIGYVSLYVAKDQYQIINFFISDAFQNKTYGTQAAKACILFLQKTYHAQIISLPVQQDNQGAKRFWTRLGFVASDTVEDGYVFMRKQLPMVPCENP